MAIALTGLCAVSENYIVRQVGDMSVADITAAADPPILKDIRRQTNDAGFLKALNNAVTGIEEAETQHTESSEFIAIGRISGESPTVSHLLISHPQFSDRCWDIIHNQVNSAKPYTSLQPGTKVLLNTKTMELSFLSKSGAVPDNKLALPAPDQNIAHGLIQHGSLADAVKPFIGTPYDQIDCYELVIKGLVNQGVQYWGKGGLREKLESLATDNGLPHNAYFSGEGLVEKAGTKSFSKAIPKIHDIQKRTEEIYAEMEPFLREGHILSFSTTTRGHTGVISRAGDDWTYINSGIIDNEISPGRASKRVGEEFLKAEIRNWCKLAEGRNEPLTVTVGHIDENKLQANKKQRVKV